MSPSPDAREDGREDEVEARLARRGVAVAIRDCGLAADGETEREGGEDRVGGGGIAEWVGMVVLWRPAPEVEDDRTTVAGGGFRCEMRDLVGWSCVGRLAGGNVNDGTLASGLGRPAPLLPPPRLFGVRKLPPSGGGLSSSLVTTGLLPLVDESESSLEARRAVLLANRDDDADEVERCEFCVNGERDAGEGAELAEVSFETFE